MDQLRAYYGVGRAGRRWWKYLLWGVINVDLVNEYVLWTRFNRPLPANKRVFSFKAFKRGLISDLTSEVSDRVVRLPCSLVDRDKSLVEGLLVTEKRKWHRCKMKLHDLFWSCNYI